MKLKSLDEARKEWEYAYECRSHLYDATYGSAYSHVVRLHNNKENHRIIRYFQTGTIWHASIDAEGPSAEDLIPYLLNEIIS